jgi:hypothetical protein
MTALALAVGSFFVANQVLASSARVEKSVGVAEPGQPELVAPTDTDMPCLLTFPPA